MKNTLFLMMVALTMLGCNKDDNELRFEEIDRFFHSGKSIYDGISYIAGIKDDYIYKFSEDGTLIWKNRIEYPPKTISESYGKTVELEYKHSPTVALFKDNYALDFMPSNIETSSTVRYFYLDICKPNGMLVKRIKHEDDLSIYSWTNDVILVIENRYKKYWLNSIGEKTELAYKADLDFYTNYIPINCTGYVTYDSERFSVVNFQTGERANSVLYTFIMQNYGNDFRLNITSVEVAETDIFVKFTVNMRNNDSYNIRVKINATTFLCEKV